MQERRRIFRRKAFLGGHLAFNRRHSSMDCTLRNMSDRGAKLVFAGIANVPDEFDLEVPHMQRTVRARVVWRGRGELGVLFVNRRSARDARPLDHAIRIRQLEAERDALQQRVSQLGGAE